MKIPLLPPVVPPHVFCLMADGVTWANVRRDPVPGFVDSRHFAYPPNTLGSGPSGTPLFTTVLTTSSVISWSPRRGARTVIAFVETATSYASPKKCLIWISASK